MNDYDAFAEAYAAETEHSLVNAYYERPAMTALAGDVTGRRILDAGCGSGPLLEDWGSILAELRRVLRPGGRLIASVDHPFVAYTFATRPPVNSSPTTSRPSRRNPACGRGPRGLKLRASDPGPAIPADAVDLCSTVRTPHASQGITAWATTTGT
ncbi:hypothetical protein ACIGO8_12900 [Streptomyces sp. NPDC053493]|uniref:hypothetical protein n=1 Tax=Streptomyces sp. NPDC053493 TaxID=3365705 RepID=UPI0037D0F8BD